MRRPFPGSICGFLSKSSRTDLLNFLHLFIIEQLFCFHIFVQIEKHGNISLGDRNLNQSLSKLVKASQRTSGYSEEVLDASEVERYISVSQSSQYFSERFILRNIFEIPSHLYMLSVRFTFFQFLNILIHISVAQVFNVC